MFTRLEAHIAWRYLVAKKSHSAVNAISIVSVCGIAVATMAIVCVLSVFNGFKQVLSAKLDQLTPQVRIEPSVGKVIANADSLCSVLQQLPEVQYASCTVQDKALALFSQREMPVNLIGVQPDEFSQMTAVQNLILRPGNMQLDVPIHTETQDISGLSDEELLFADAEDLYADSPGLLPQDSIGYQAVISVGVASSLQIYNGEKQPLYLYTPRRLGRVNMGNPASSFLVDSLPVCGVFKADQPQYDLNTVIVDIRLARKLLQYDAEASYVDLQLQDGVDVQKYIARLQQQVGDGYVVKDRLMQQEMNFRMISIEKWVTFLLLGFILLVASFNIISAMSMLIVDKEGSIKILGKLGATPGMIGRIFGWQSVFVNGIGVVSGIVLGLVLCLIQQHFGVIGFGNESAKMIIDAYPVQVQWTDMPAILLLVSVIAALTSLIAMRFAKSKTV